MNREGKMEMGKANNNPACFFCKVMDDVNLRGYSMPRPGFKQIIYKNKFKKEGHDRDNVIV